MRDRKRKKQGRRRQRQPDAGDQRFLTIAQYGPDDRTVTKIVASLFRDRYDESGKLTKRWVAAGITESPEFRKELVEPIKKTRARRIVFTAGVLGCIHEEGKDYPRGQECPFCPFWRGRDRWANARPVIMSPGMLDEDRPWPSAGGELRIE